MWRGSIQLLAHNVADSPRRLGVGNWIAFKPAAVRVLEEILARIDRVCRCSPVGIGFGRRGSPCHRWAVRPRRILSRGDETGSGELSVVGRKGETDRACQRHYDKYPTKYRFLLTATGFHHEYNVPVSNCVCYPTRPSTLPAVRWDRETVCQSALANSAWRIAGSGLAEQLSEERQGNPPP